MRGCQDFALKNEDRGCRQIRTVASKAAFRVTLIALWRLRSSLIPLCCHNPAAARNRQLAVTCVLAAAVRCVMDATLGKAFRAREVAAQPAPRGLAGSARVGIVCEVSGI